ncbi:MAG: hypothetical protein ACJ75I_05735 [Solirubrobacterales bacterium]
MPNLDEPIGTVERARDLLESDREQLERRIATLQIERNEMRRAMRSNPDTCHSALERAVADGEKELHDWLASTRTDGTPRPPNAVVIARYLFETTDFGDWLAAKLDEAIKSGDRTFDGRSTRQLKRLHGEVEAKLVEARAELRELERTCLDAGAAVRAAERGDQAMVERFLAQRADA